MRRAPIWILSGALASTLACGYKVAGEIQDPLGPFEVVPGPVTVPHAGAIVAAEAGARAALARAGALGRCPRPTCAALELEILRVDEEAVGVAISRRAGDDLPLSRGLKVTVIGRARLRVGTESQRDTGDMSASEVVASPFPSRPDAEVRSAASGAQSSRSTALVELSKAEAARRAARRLGERLVQRILGAPEPTAD